MSKILIVEDDSKARDAMAELLRDAGYEVLAAASGEEAIARLGTAGELPSLMLLDLVMPGMNGWQLHAWLRQDPLYSRIPVVLLSAIDDLGRDARALRASGYLVKPVAAERLLEIVASHLGARAA